MTITLAEARKKLNNKDLSDQEVTDILAKLYSLCKRAVDKTIEEKYGK